MTVGSSPAGKSVVILEAGPAQSLDDLVSSTLYARRLKWSGPPVLDEGDKPVGFVFNAGYGTGGSSVSRLARLRRGPFRPPSGLSILAMIPVATRV